MIKTNTEAKTEKKIKRSFKLFNKNNQARNKII